VPYNQGYYEQPYEPSQGYQEDNDPENVNDIQEENQPSKTTIKEDSNLVK